MSVFTDGMPVPEYMLVEKAELHPDGSVIAKVFEAVCKAVLDSGKLIKAGTE